MKIVVIGADGQLGTDLVKLRPGAVPLTLKELDITSLEQCRAVLSKLAPGVVINTAANNQVDASEDDPQPAFRVNVFGARNLALACRELGAELVHFSTDYVFAGDRGAPYLEEDVPGPLSAYGISKLAGEQMVRYLWPKHYLIRTSGLYGAAGCLGKGGTNFVEVMIGRAGSGQALKVVNDETAGPTYTYDLARKLLQLLDQRSYGLYHITNAGQCSWYEFTLKIFELLGRKVAVTPVGSAEFPAKARRPKFSVLAHGHLRRLGLDDLRPWDEALRAYLVEKGHLAGGAA